MKKAKKLLAVLMAVALTFAGTAISAEAATTILQYRAGNFTSYAPSELIYLTEDTDVITFIGHCSGNTPDLVTCEIVDRDHGGVYNMSFDFWADGEATLYECYFPSGEYRIYFTANSDILKTRVTVDFAKADYL